MGARIASRLQSTFVFVFVFVLALGASTGCVSATVIHSQPEGALVLEDGVVQGQTPFSHEDTDTFGTSHFYVLQAVGYKPMPVIIRRDQLNATHAVSFGVAGCFISPMWLGLLWSGDYAPEYNVVLVPKSARLDDGLAIPPPPPLSQEPIPVPPPAVPR
jgi:hypothetical protein